MKRKLVRAAVTIRTGVRHFEGGRATRKFDRALDELLARRSELYRRLAR
jgi:hypothetical protein